MLNIIICDDDSSFSGKLKEDIYSLLDSLTEASQLDYSCDVVYPAAQLLEYARTNHIDILFLDVEMPDMNGMKIAEYFFEHSKDTKIIFVSSFEEYVFYSIRFNPFRFIRKSNVSAELAEAVSSAVFDILLSDKYLIFNGRYEKFSIQISRILYVTKEKHKNYMMVKCVNEEYRVRGTIHSIYEQLKDSFFVRVNSGTLVNMKYIFNISEDQLTLTDESRHGISRDLKKHLSSEYLRYIRHMNGGV